MRTKNPNHVFPKRIFKISLITSISYMASIVLIVYDSLSKCHRFESYLQILPKLLGLGQLTPNYAGSPRIADLFLQKPFLDDPTWLYLFTIFDGEDLICLCPLTSLMIRTILSLDCIFLLFFLNTHTHTHTTTSTNNNNCNSIEGSAHCNFGFAEYINLGTQLGHTVVDVPGKCCVCPANSKLP